MDSKKVKMKKIKEIQENLLKIHSNLKNKKNKDLKETYTKDFSLLLESELERAETILAVKEVNKKLQDMAEDLARMQAEDIMPIVDSIKTNFSTEVADRFSEVSTEQLQAALTALRNAKDSINTEGLKLEGKISDEDVKKPTNDMSMAEEEPKKEIETPEVDVEEDPFAGSDSASGPKEEPLGRMKKESIKKNKKMIGESPVDQIMAFSKKANIEEEETTSRIYKISQEEAQDIWKASALDQKKEKAIELAKKFFAGKPSINLEINKLKAMSRPNQIDGWVTQMLLHGEGLGLGTGRRKKSTRNESVENKEEQKKNSNTIDIDTFKTAKKAIDLISKNKIYNTWSEDMTREIENWFKLDASSKEPINQMYSHEIELLLKMNNRQTSCIDKFFRAYSDPDRTYKNYKDFCKSIDQEIVEDLSDDLSVAISRMPAASKAQLSRALSQDNENKDLAMKMVDILKKSGARI